MGKEDVCRADIVTAHKAAAFQKGSSGYVCYDRVSNFPEVAVVIQAVLVSCIVIQILLKQTSWIFNAGFDIICSIGNGRSLAEVIYS